MKTILGDMAWKMRRIFDLVSMNVYFVLKGHLLNPIWYPRKKRKEIRLAAKGDSVRVYLRAYLPEIKKINTPSPISNDKEPERVFTIWLQGEANAPAIVKACFRNMRRHLRQELVVIDATTLFDWIALPDYIVEKWRSGKIGSAHFSDICRVELLYRHGGLWLDSTDFVTAPVPDEIMNTDFFVFMSGRTLSGWYAFIQNCFIRARKGDPLLAAWREAIRMYWKRENGVVNYYTHQILFHLTVVNNDQAYRLFSNMPRIDQDPTHIMWYKHKDDSYDREFFASLKQNAFFHKTTYKDKSALNPPNGSIAEHIINDGE